ncbi:Mak10 subunit, NatC N-terminal acetyltransferase-domain-containing protein [Leucosporidium creatinivorum]|uniref:Mak10 subunit, NatC N-terminal acetyltransferase-domain-containing protein n=1 Tax=Leucosporidium creatinivorum TaxID=106004 RepID=A0A1Y2EUQ2_9BASI|nr:Mak10 subunit, NatC N-terminal acetyltransferase-domain-containing protein [Leucosporidium creatinivorum]
MAQAATFVDARPLLEAALADLAPGQLIHDDRVSLMDLMSAVEIMDPRTDSFLALKQGREKEQELPPFNPAHELLPEELLWILDELLRLETTFQDGHPLASTLFTCHYLRPAALASLSFAPDSLGDAQRLAGFRAVLRAMLLGVIKSTEIIWEELAKGQVYEHEDVHLGMASLEFSTLLAACYPPEPVSRLRMPGQADTPRIVTVDEVLHALSEALAWVMEQGKDESLKLALMNRLTLRINLVYGLALLTSPPHTSPEVVSSYLALVSEGITALSATPLPSFEPSLQLLAAFALGTTAPLPSPQPAREIPPFPIKQAWKSLEKLTLDLESAVKLWELWTKGAGWSEVREYHVALSRRDMTPYARSAHQTITCASRTLFASSATIALSSSFFEVLAGVPPSTWSTLASIREGESTWDAPARKLLGFAERVSAQLVANLSIRCQNRARARRLVVKGFKQLAQLVEEAEDLQSRLEDTLPPTPSLKLLPTALRALLLTELLEALLSGFDLHLYDGEEWTRVWWVAERLVERLQDVLEQLRRQGDGGSYVEAKSLEAKGLRAMCQASLRMALLFPPVVPKFGSPVLAFDYAEDRDQKRFEKRFGWLKGSLGATELPLDGLASWEEFTAELSKLGESSNKIEEASQSYQAAIAAFTAFGAIPLAARGCSNKPEHQLKWVASIRRTSFANSNLLGTVARQAAASVDTPQAREEDVHWDCPWFPIWV